MPTILPLVSATTALALSVPTQWVDVTLAQFVAIHAPEPTETRRKAEVLCNLPAGYLDDLAANDVAYLANLLAFSADPADVLALLPTPGLPDIGTLPYGVLLLAQQHVEAQGEREWLSAAPYLLALYRVQLVYGKYDQAKAEACEAALLAAPVTESYADCAFFLTSYRNYWSDTHQTKATPTAQNPKKRKLAQKSLRSASGSFGTWMRRLVGMS
ncbi:MAG: hypothetical protein ACRYG7_13085 [Janthinobacterium lividum]